jgi:hypothetical protein
MMKRAHLQTLVPLAMLALCSCSSTVYGPIDTNTPGATYEQGVPGGTLARTRQVRATVNSIDPAMRQVTLTTKDGKKTTVKCSPDVQNFDQLRVGDVVKARVTDEITVSMATAATPEVPIVTGSRTLAPNSAGPGVAMSETQEYIARIIEINQKKRQVTLRFPEGSTRTFIVRQDVDLNQRHVGEEVAFKVAMAMAVSVEKP